MSKKSIGYHTRSRENANVKLTGGSFGGALDTETVERLTKAHFTIKMLPSGSLTFIDKEGRSVWLYVSIDPSMTEAGKRLLADDAAKRQADARRLEDRLNELLDGMTAEEAIKRLEIK